MRKRILTLFGVSCLALSAVLQLQADDKEVPVRRVLRIRREEVKLGKASAHQKLEAGFPAALRKADSNAHYMAMSALTGPSEVWFVSNYSSFAGWEKSRSETSKNDTLRADLDQLSERDGELLTGATEFVAVSREDLSYKARPDLTRLHYFRVTMVRVRPGHESDFADVVKLSADGCEKAKADCNWATYQVTAGLPGSTFLIMTSYKTLAEIETAMASGKAGTEALGQMGQRAIARAQAEGYMHFESNIFKVEPSMSYVVPAGLMESMDPEFWTVKPPANAPSRKK